MIELMWFMYSACGKNFAVDQVCVRAVRQTAVILCRRLIPREGYLSWREESQIGYLGHSWPGEVPCTRQELLLGGFR